MPLPTAPRPSCANPQPAVSATAATRITQKATTTTPSQTTVEAIQLNPKDAAAFNNRGSAYFAKGQSDRAIADYSQAIQLNPKDAVAFNNRGNAYYANGDHERAIADYNQVIQIDPKNSRAYLNRGLANLYLGAPPKAQADLNQASALDPNDVYVALWLDIANKRSKSASRLAKATTQSDLTKWPGPIIRFYLGKMKPADLLAAADCPDPATKKAQICEVNFYSAELALAAAQEGSRSRAIPTGGRGLPEILSRIRFRQSRT